MKLVIQIPCFNEEASLPATLSALPRTVKGFETVEWLVIDDGSTDDTVGVARRLGVDHIVSFARNRGLARAFMAGIEEALKLGADVIVNTDGDNQYDAACIPDLVRPILEGQALLVVGARPISEIDHFSPAKKLLQKLGSWAVRRASGADIPDAPSGFRAIHREAALRLYAFGAYTYTLETIIQAGRIGLPVASVDIRVNGELRPSRLIPSVFSYVWRSTITILRVFVLYKPLRFFLILAAIFAAPGLLGLGRFLFLWATGEGGGHIQSVVISSGFLAMSVVILIGGILSDLVAANRVLLEDIRSRLLRRDVEDTATRLPSEDSTGAEAASLMTRISRRRL
jgi:glycosyltransferase involved in cell wall biosynthesis